MNKHKIKVELQYFKGCPHFEEMRQNVHAALKSYKNDIEFFETEIVTQDEAMKHNFRGSPTLLMNNQDFENMLIPEHPGMTCRYYPTGIPTSEQIRNKLKNIT